MKMTTTWKPDEFERLKQQVNEEIKSYQETRPLKEVGGRLTEEIAHLAGTINHAGYMRRFLYIMHALILQSKYGLFSASQARDLCELAETILQINNIQPSRSKLSRIYSEYLFVRSQIALSTGELWSATWLQQLALEVADGPFFGDSGFQDISMGVRASRLGYLNIAVEYFASAEKGQLTPRDAGRARTGRIQALRLSGRHQAARDLAQMTLARAETFLPHAQAEALWESRCLEVALDSGDTSLQGLFVLCKPGKPHYTTSYLLELCLWSYAVTSPKYLTDMVRMETLRRKKSLNFDPYGDILKFCRDLEDLYGGDLTFPRKFARIERMAAAVNRFRQLSFRLLGWLSIARWLARHKSQKLALFVVTEYRGLSLRLSDGLSQDVLGIADGLLIADAGKREAGPKGPDEDRQGL